MPPKRSKRVARKRDAGGTPSPPPPPPPRKPRNAPKNKNTAKDAAGGDKSAPGTRAKRRRAEDDDTEDEEFVDAPEGAEEEEVVEGDGEDDGEVAVVPRPRKKGKVVKKVKIAAGGSQAGRPQSDNISLLQSNRLRAVFERPVFENGEVLYCKRCLYHMDTAEWTMCDGTAGSITGKKCWRCSKEKHACEPVTEPELVALFEQENRARLACEPVIDRPEGLQTRLEDRAVADMERALNGMAVVARNKSKFASGTQAGGIGGASMFDKLASIDRTLRGLFFLKRADVGRDHVADLAEADRIMGVIGRRGRSVSYSPPPRMSPAYIAGGNSGLEEGEDRLPPDSPDEFVRNRGEVARVSDVEEEDEDDDRSHVSP